MEVGIPNFSRFVMGMADVMTEDWPLPTDVTHFCHDRTSNLDFNQINPTFGKLQEKSEGIGLSFC